MNPEPVTAVVVLDPWFPSDGFKVSVAEAEGKVTVNTLPLDVISPTFLGAQPESTPVNFTGALVEPGFIDIGRLGELGGESELLGYKDPLLSETKAFVICTGTPPVFLMETVMSLPEHDEANARFSLPFD